MSRGLLILFASALLLHSAIATVDYCSLLHSSLLFYEAQRSGRQPSSNRIPWRGNSCANDDTAGVSSASTSGNGDLSGGYYDAGDGVKFVFPMAFTLTTLSWTYIEFGDTVRECGENSYFLDAIKWGTDWLIKAHTNTNEFYGQVGNGGTDHSFWQPPELYTMSRPSYKIDQSNPGTDLAMEVASALAAASIVFSSVDATYSNTLLSHAKQMYNFGNTYRGKYSDSIPDAANYYNSYSYNDELVWGASWLYRATGDNSYLNAAVSGYSSMGIKNMAAGQSFNWDQKSPGVILNMWKITGQQTYISDAQNWLNSWLPGNGMTYTPGGLAWQMQWGPLRYVSGSAFIALLIDSSSANSWAAGQIGYILGNNPKRISYVAGYGSSYPVNVHHRAAHGSTTNDINSPVNNLHILTGALVGGPDQNDQYADVRTDYVKNEVAMDYNAGFTGAIVALAKLSGSSSSTPTTKAPSVVPTSIPTRAPTTAPTIPTSSTIKVNLSPSSSVWWAAVSISGTSFAVTNIELKDSGSYSSSWTALTSTDWGYWTFQPTSQIVLPISLRLTSSAGQVVLTNIITSITNFGTIDSSIQFGSLRSTSASISSTKAPTDAPTTVAPTKAPTVVPTTVAPTQAPTVTPTVAPTQAPTVAPTSIPTAAPTVTPTSGPTSSLQLQMHPSANNYWLALAVVGGSATTASVQVKDSGSLSSFTAMSDLGWGFWVYQPVNGPLVAPITIKATSSNGKTVITTISSIVANQMINTNAQY